MLIFLGVYIPLWSLFLMGKHFGGCILLLLCISDLPKIITEYMLENDSIVHGTSTHKTQTECSKASSNWTSTSCLLLPARIHHLCRGKFIPPACHSPRASSQREAWDIMDAMDAMGPVGQCFTQNSPTNMTDITVACGCMWHEVKSWKEAVISKARLRLQILNVRP